MRQPGRASATAEIISLPERTASISVAHLCQAQAACRGLCTHFYIIIFTLLSSLALRFCPSCCTAQLSMLGNLFKSSPGGKQITAAAAANQSARLAQLVALAIANSLAAKGGGRGKGNKSQTSIPVNDEGLQDKVAVNETPFSLRSVSLKYQCSSLSELDSV